MSVNPRRWWTLRALGRNPLARGVDRLQAWALVAGVVLLLVAAHYATGYAQTTYTARSQTVALESATRHPVEATALTASTSIIKGPVSAQTLTYSDHVQWFAQNATHDQTVPVEQPVKAGEHVRIWLDADGNVTTPPRTDDIANADAVGAGALLWLLCLAVVGVAFETLRRVLDRIRRRTWDRDLQLLVEDGGGSSTPRMS